MLHCILSTCIQVFYYIRYLRICGKSTTSRTFSQTNTGEASPFLIRFNSQKTHTPGAGFTVKVEAVKSGTLSIRAPSFLILI